MFYSYPPPQKKKKKKKINFLFFKFLIIFSKIPFTHHWKWKRFCKARTGAQPLIWITNWSKEIDVLDNIDQIIFHFVIINFPLWCQNMTKQISFLRALNFFSKSELSQSSDLSQYPVLFSVSYSLCINSVFITILGS